MVSEASRPDHEDDLEHPILCVKHMHRIAADALLDFGFEPRRMTVDE